MSIECCGEQRNEKFCPNCGTDLSTKKAGIEQLLEHAESELRKHISGLDLASRDDKVNRNSISLAKSVSDKRGKVRMLRKILNLETVSKLQELGLAAKRFVAVGIDPEVLVSISKINKSVTLECQSDEQAMDTREAIIDILIAAKDISGLPGKCP